LVFLLGGTVGFFASRKWRWTVFVFSPLLALIATGRLLELWGPFVGAAIEREAGIRYFIWSYVSIVFGVAMPIAGTLTPRKRPDHRAFQ
jgi:hypothetical protein